MNIPFEHSVLDSALERMDIADIAQATIRQSGDIARLMEQATGTEFIHSSAVARHIAAVGEPDAVQAFAQAAVVATLSAAC